MRIFDSFTPFVAYNVTDRMHRIVQCSAGKAHQRKYFARHVIETRPRARVLACTIFSQFVLEQVGAHSLPWRGLQALQSFVVSLCYLQ